MEARQYQTEMLDAILKAYVDGLRRILVVAATGTGKTVVFSQLKKKLQHLLPGKMLVFAHREELIDQAVRAVQRANPELKVGKEMAGFYADDDCDVIVSCVASIGRTGSTRLSRFGRFDLVVCDEAHHSIAQTYLNVFESTGLLAEGTRSLLVGFTATPKRHDRIRKNASQQDELVSLKSVYQKIVYTYPIRKAVKDGWLVPLRGYRVVTNTDLSNVKMTAGDFQQDQLNEAIDKAQRNQLVLDSWLKYGEGRQTVGFTSGIEHAQNLAQLFRQRGIAAEAVWGDDPERKTKLEKHKQKEITVLFNAQVLTEGYDDWQVSCILLAAPTSNSSKYTQEVGRGTRLQEGIGNLIKALSEGYCLTKRDCIIIDLVDNSKRCSLVTLPSLVGLNPDLDLRGESVTTIVEKIEALQDKFPGVPFNHLTDVATLDSYVESIDMFADPCPEEVKEFSQLQWMVAADDSYILHIPEKKELREKKQYSQFLHEKLYIKQNELDEYELSIESTKQSRSLGTYNSLKEAFETADEVVRRCRPDRIKLMQREQSWQNNLASEAAKKYLAKLSRNKPMPYCLCPDNRPAGVKCPTCGRMTGITAGQASNAINLLQNRR